MKLRAHIVHDMPGRIRVRLPELRGNAELSAQLEHMLAESGLFEGVRANPVTASVVLEFNGSREDVFAALREHVPIELELAPPPAPARAPSAASAEIDPVRLVSGRDVNFMFLAGTLFGAIGLVQALRGRIMLPALSAFWYASNAFRLARAQAGDPAAGNEASAASS